VLFCASAGNVPMSWFQRDCQRPVWLSLSFFIQCVLPGGCCVLKMSLGHVCASRPEAVAAAVSLMCVLDDDCKHRLAGSVGCHKDGP
jgi:hypothetical protein